ncbi:MAG: hypothetical protein AVDCRST_MAG03-2597 [uncultured Rubrobacteraceae bacterium]|uniref:Uncharacterized protein n=1 Tax=uncultured Rubrobacteraceae bacterium TaxID=349277 RepID=A0A6J4PR22_9ACTN|nr:MAG: hypothetical protein AVDCRST_MAG03-2597 [uncultured Rubrobacteraceae bacterium]
MKASPQGRPLSLILFGPGVLLAFARRTGSSFRARRPRL